MFFFKCLSKILYLVLVAYVSAEEDCVSASAGSSGLGVGVGVGGSLLDGAKAINLNNQCATYESLNFKEGYCV